MTESSNTIFLSIWNPFLDLIKQIYKSKKD